MLGTVDHEHIGEALGINVRPVVADVRADVEKWIGLGRIVATWFTLAKTR